MRCAPPEMAFGLHSGLSRPRRRRRNSHRLAEINVTPFVDVMLVLLIVFMITAPLLTTGVTVDLPRAETGPLPGQDEPLAVTLAADGTIYIQESPIAAEQLAPRLAAIAGRNPHVRIFVRADRRLDYGRVMDVIGRIHAAGFTRVALVTEAPIAWRAELPAASAERRR